MFDDVLGGLVEAWQDAQGLILITSDHGNMEDLLQRGANMPRFRRSLSGPPSAREHFAANLVDLTGIAPAIYTLLTDLCVDRTLLLKTPLDRRIMVLKRRRAS